MNIPIAEPLFHDPPACRYCKHTNPDLCAHEEDIAQGIRDPYAPRPSSCLKSAQNREGVPY